jgi:cytidine deaminase
MKWNEIKIAYREYANLGELPEDWKSLIMRARDVSDRAWAPYSGFKVGAAVKLVSGLIVAGNNQENAAYPAGLCAERTALFYANANFPNDPVDVIAVTAKNVHGWVEEPVKPCGGCRQALLEVETRYNRKVTILLDGQKAIYVLDGVDGLLPLNFTRSSLGNE